jgi:TrmH family RNA methyltransferase
MAERHGTIGPMVIDSPANPKVRAAAALRERRDRDRTGLTIVDGAREARRAIEAGVEVETAFVCPELATGAEAHAALAALRAAGGAGRVIEVGGRAFEKLAYGDRSDGIVLVVRPPSATLDRLALGPDPLVIVTEAVEKPGNLGAILRSADGAGADAVVAVGGTDLFNPNVIRASVGTVFSVPIAAATAAEARTWLLARGIRLLAARTDASHLHVEADLRGPLAIVLGSEAQGLSATWAGPDVEGIRLPMAGIADSLNVSVAGGVLLYEAWRQRHPGG